MTVDGYDVAGYQTASFSLTNQEFLFVKATEGTTFVNSKHDAQVKHGRDSGLVIGHYHFARPGSMNAQLSFFRTNAKVQKGDLIAFDWEDSGVSNSDKDAWLKAAKTMFPSHRVVLYCNRDFWINRDHTSYCGDGLWIADPNSPAAQPNVSLPWTFHQYSSTGGIDHNKGNFSSLESLKIWAGVIPAPPKYEPYPGKSFFVVGKKSKIVAAMHTRLVAEGCNRYLSAINKDIIGSGDVSSYEAWQRKYNADQHKGWTGDALKWPPGKETWDALKVPNV